MTQTVVGFTKGQRKWFLERDGHRCMHRTRRFGIWVRCKNTRNLQVHHILPRGWGAKHFANDFPLNGSLNGICLCPYHHIGSPDSVHPDTFIAKKKYKKGDKDAFNHMIRVRRKLNEIGEPYWNTKWDWMYMRLAKKATASFSRKKPYPKNSKRGLNGRE